MFEYFTIIASGVIVGLIMWNIKITRDLCERVTRLETKKESVKKRTR